MRVCFVPSDTDAPGHYRCLFPARQLKDHGVEVVMPDREEKERELTLESGRKVYRTVFNVRFDLPKTADVYVWQQWKERILAETGIHRLRGAGIATVMDVDDNYVSLPEYNPAFYGSHPYRMANGTIRNRAQRRADKKHLKPLGGKMPPPNSSNRMHMLDSIRMVDLVTVSTPRLAEVYAPYHKDIRVIRNCVDWDIWSDVTPQYEVERERPRIGWFGSFAYRSGDLEVVRRPLQRFLRDHPEVDFVTNSEETHNFLGVPEQQRITLGEYNFLDRETGNYLVGEMTAQCDIGLVPLAMNDLNQGKSHLKGMEYNAAGIPFIASPTESYQWWKGRSDIGGLARSESDWYEWMQLLIEDPASRRKMGYRGRLQARRWSVQQRWRDWCSVYEELAGDEYTARARKAIPMGAVQKVSELAPFLRLVAEKRPKTIVEIGTARGGTLWAVAQTAPDDAMVISIDIPSGSPMDVSNGQDVYKGRDRDRLKLFIKANQRLKLIDMNSQSAGAVAALTHALEGRQIDLLFIDGDHRYEGVKHDYETYSKLVAPDGIIAFHDIVEHEDKRVGVHRLWAEINGRKEEFVGPETWGFKPWGGIGVVHGVS